MSTSVLLVGGFGLPAAVLAPLARELGGRIAPTGLTIGCGEREVRRVEQALDTFPDRVTIVGHSRGGQLARVVAARHPDQVQALVTAGTPRSIGPPTRWGVPVIAAALRPLPFDLALDCATALCCASFRDDLAKPVEVPWTLIWSRRDRIVDDAYDPQARTVEIDTSHLGMITSATGRAAIVKAVEA